MQISLFGGEETQNLGYVRPRYDVSLRFHAIRSLRSRAARVTGLAPAVLSRRA